MQWVQTLQRAVLRSVPRGFGTEATGDTITGP
jgi:hypothetical protein